jgi:hypothetical protein
VAGNDDRFVGLQPRPDHHTIIDAAPGSHFSYLEAFLIVPDYQALLIARADNAFSRHVDDIPQRFSL